MANDTYDQHYIEKLWSLVPGYHRDLDGRPATTTDPGGRNQLRALVEVLGAQAAVLRRSADRTWDDQFIDLCDDWAVPYIGELVATRMLPALDSRARRIDVAKTIYYRRRKGTPRVLEELITDIAGWGGVVVEEFRRLGRTWHRFDQPPLERRGPFTATPPGGTADLRSPFGAELAPGSFSEYSHTADVRRHQGTDGRRSITKIGFHLYRLVSVPVFSMRPLPAGGVVAGYTFDPLERDVPLFAGSARDEQWDDWRPALPWEVASPISCRLLNHAIYDVTPESIAAAIVALPSLSDQEKNDLRLLRSRVFASAGELHDAIAEADSGGTLDTVAVHQAVEAASITDDCGKSALLNGSIAITDDAGLIPPEQIIAGDLSNWRTPPTGYRAIIDPARGRILFDHPQSRSPRADIRIGTVGAVGANPLPRAQLPASTQPIDSGGQLPALVDGGIAQIDDSLVYEPTAADVVAQKLVLQAAEGERPFVGLDSDWVFSSVATSAELTLDGLWLGGGNQVVLRGDFDTVTIRRCTFDAGTLAAGDGVTLQVEANVARLIIDRSLMSRITIDAAAVVPTITITDSVVDGDDSDVSAGVAIAADRSTLDLRGVTVIGRIDALRMWADEVLATGTISVTDTQTGCFRFSAAPDGSRLPHPYESTVTPPASPFTTRAPGQPAYAQLRAGVGVDLARGGEHGSELGAYAHLNQPISYDSLRTKVEEYLPFGLVPYYVFAT
ncbi:MAG: hypothetical protein GY713_11705 [Actinomycetia bacterium]|nr:hypothetical protein [Actinomycetes bacterium]